ncbi:MAG: hypothetical protein IJV72_01150 [Clostridia bacterium]|nr:hypothetical protein [Clostridia bacterium]
MKKMPKAGFLPLYVKIYDESTPEMRVVVDKFVADTAKKLTDMGIELVCAPVCRLKNEFESAVASFESADVDFIITLHAAYSPSLESYEALCSTSLPILMLDTTYNYEFKPYSYAEGMLYNHGIHGVMDLCNLLRRNRRQYEIIAGFFGDENPDYESLKNRVMSFAKACLIKHTLSRSKIGLVGEQFEGMGDFRISFEELKDTLGIEVVKYDVDKNIELINSVTDEEIEAEYKLDCERFEVFADRETYNFSTRASLAVRKWIEKEGLNGFSMNFKSAKKGTGFPTMPFAEASLAMSRGIGYAGEGDVLTAAFTAALMSVFDEVSFTEIFCPDWKDGSLFLSHMGEYNVALSSPEKKPVMGVKDFVFGDADNPTIVLAPFKAGRMVFISLNPVEDGGFEIFSATGDMLYTPHDNRQNTVVNGWFKPDMPLEKFLEEYSYAGGMHHAALIYGGDTVVEVIENLKKLF